MSGGYDASIRSRRKPMKRLILCCLLVTCACSVPEIPTGPDEDVGIVRILNSSGDLVVEVRISPCEENNWGENRLDGGALQPGDSRDFRLTPDCYDVRVVGATGAEARFFDLILESRVILPITVLDSQVAGGVQR
jgi:hypothetical protein